MQSSLAKVARSCSHTHTHTLSLSSCSCTVGVSLIGLHNSTAASQQASFGFRAKDLLYVLVCCTVLYCIACLANETGLFAGIVGCNIETADECCRIGRNEGCC